MAYLGKPACWAKSASMTAAPGSFSEGFRTNVLPAVTAIGNIHRGIMAGKLKGQMPAQTCVHKTADITKHSEKTQVCSIAVACCLQCHTLIMMLASLAVATVAASLP